MRKIETRQGREQTSKVTWHVTKLNGFTVAPEAHATLR